MNRRGFLGMLAASIAGLAIDPTKLLWRPTPSAPLILPDALVSLDRITFEVFRRLSERVGRGHLVDDDRLGGACPHHFWVEMALPTDLNRDGLCRQRYIEPIADALYDWIKARGIRSFGQLPVPQNVERAVTIKSNTRGLAMRCLQAYRLDSDAPSLRFEILGGAA